MSKRAHKLAMDLWVQMLLEAIASGRLWEVRNMLKDGDSPNVVHCFADTARCILDEEEVEMLLESNGAQQNADSFFTTTPLITALVSRQKLEMLRFLLAVGADPNFPNQHGETPLMFCQTLAASRLLVKHGAELNARDKNGWTALLHSPKGKITRFLLEQGADANVVGKDGMTALIHSPDLEATEALLAAGADPNARTAEGATALMYADDMRQIELLLEAGADATCVDEDGMTPLHYAAIMNHHRVIPFWAERFDVNAKDKGGRTPFDVALAGDSRTSRNLLFKLGGMPGKWNNTEDDWDASILFPDFFDDMPEELTAHRPYRQR